MNRRSFLSRLPVVAGILASALFSFTAAPSFAEDAPQFFLVDVLILKEGKTAEDAKAYFDKVAPIAAKHGLVQLHPLKVAQKLRGDLDAKVVNIWSVSEPKKTLPNVLSDPEYQKNVPIRDSVFDLPNSSIFMTVPN